MTASLSQQAADYAQWAHYGQVRKYTGEPYFNHCREVAAIVRTVSGTEEMIAAAYLHDTIEDTGVRMFDLNHAFGRTVAAYVCWLTKVPHLVAHMQKTTQEQATLERLASAPVEVRTIKLADLISNLRTVRERDPEFAAYYVEKKRRQFEVLKDGNPILVEYVADLLK